MGVPEASGLHGGSALLHSQDDVLVARAAAQVAFELFANLCFVGVGMALTQVHRTHHHARGAKAALQTVALLERRLHRVQRAVGSGQPFDGGDLAALDLDRKSTRLNSSHT